MKERLIAAIKDLNELLELEPAIKIGKKDSEAALTKKIQKFQNGDDGLMGPDYEPKNKANSIKKETLETLFAAGIEDLPATWDQYKEEEKPKAKSKSKSKDKGKSEEKAQETTGKPKSSKAADKTKGKKKSETKSEAKEEKPKGKAKPKTKAKKGPGVIASIVEIIQKKKKITKADLLEELSKRFPDREATSMSRTISVQVGSRIRKEKDIPVSYDRKSDLITIDK